MHTFHYKRSGKDQEMQDVSDSDPKSVVVSEQQHSYREPQDNENSCSTHMGYSTDNESLYDFNLKSCKSKHTLPEPALGLSNQTSLSPNLNLLTWQELDSNMQAVFPTDDKYTYVVESYQSKELETFPGAPGFAFESQVRITPKK